LLEGAFKHAFLHLPNVMGKGLDASTDPTELASSISEASSLVITKRKVATALSSSSFVPNTKSMV
jgi:hypothetical protein